MWPNPQETVDLVSLTEKILNGKLFFCAVKMAQEEFSFNEVTGWMVLMFVRVHSFINVFLRSPWPFHIWCWKMTKLTLKICSVNTARFLKYISPFFNIMQGRLRFSENVF